MNQRGFGLIIYLVALAVVAAAFLGYGQYRYGQGVEKERTRNLNAVFEHEEKMSAERRKHNEEIDAIAKKHAAISDKANRQIRELLATNKTLADWWNQSIPADAATFSWLRPTDNHPLRGGPDSDSTAPDPGKTGTPN